jgi:hypothetical protein
VEGSDCDVICYLCIYLAGLGEATKSLIKVTGLRAIAESWDLPNTREFTYTTVTFGDSVAFVITFCLEYCLSTVSVDLHKVERVNESLK